MNTGIMDSDSPRNGQQAGNMSTSQKPFFKNKNKDARSDLIVNREIKLNRTYNCSGKKMKRE